MVVAWPPTKTTPSPPGADRRLRRPYQRDLAALSRTQFQLVSALTLSPIMLDPVRRVLDDIPHRST